MLIEIQCENVSSFDATVGKYVECAEKIIVSGDKAGETVECPKCNQPVEIPWPGEARSAQTANSSKEQSQSKQSTPPRTRPKALEQRSGQPRRSPKPRRESDAGRSSVELARKSRPANAGATKSGQRPRNVENEPRAKRSVDRRAAGKSAGKGVASKTTSRSSTAKRENRGVGTVAPVARTSATTDRRKQQRRKSVDANTGRRDIMAVDFQSEEVSSGLVGDQQERCKKCGNLVENARCVVCFHVDSKFEKLHCPLPDIEIQVAGCQRWLQQTMSEGVSVKFIAVAGNLLVAAMAVILLGISILFLSGLGLGSVVGGVLLFFTIVSTLFYLGVVYKSHQFMHKPAAQLAWFQKPFWRLMLFLSRFLKWERYDGALKGRRVITIRDRMFGDNDVMEHKGIKNVQVLDIQGTNLTDHGLLNLYDLKHLQCVVLRGTKVSPEAVFRFQQTFPRLWIWY